MSRLFRGGVSALALLGLGAPSAAGQTHPRQDIVDRVVDAFVSIREFGPMRASPDGRLLVVEVQRDRTSHGRGGELPRLALTDLWLVDVASGETQQLTSGARDGSSTWEALWSPDSRKIAYLTNAGDGLPRAAWMDVHTRQGGMLSERGVDIQVNFGGVSAYQRIWGAWLGADRFLMAATAPGEVVPQARTMAPDLVTPPLWARMRAGEGPVTVWDSASHLQCDANTSLVSVDIGAAANARALMTGSIRAVTLAPDHARAAIALAAGALPPPALATIDEEMNFQNLDPRVSTRLSILTLNAAAATNQLTTTTGIRFESADDGPRWSQDAGTVFVPRLQRGDDGSGKFCVDALARNGQPARAMAIACQSILSRGHAQLLAMSLAAAPPHSRLELDARIAATAADTPQSGGVFPLGDNLAAVVGDASIKLIDLLTGGRVDQLAFDRGSLVATDQPPSTSDIGVVRVAGELRLLRAQGRRLVAAAITAPIADPTPLAALAGGNALAWSAEDLQGKSLYLSDANGAHWRRVMRLERPFPADLQLERQAVHYTLPDGRGAVAILLLPPGYDPSRRYPMILDVYPDQSFDDASVNTQFRPTSIYSVDDYALAHIGYIVAEPDTPAYIGAAQDYEAASYYSGLVEAFADAAIAQGLTTQGRIGLWGHSNGGYLGLAVAGRTQRISAIVSYAPFPDLLPVAEAPAPLFQTDACAPNQLYGNSLAMVEDPNGPLWRIGAPSYQALDRLLRSSPLYQLGPQTPPTLLLQGEFDGHGTTDAERVYTRLNRQNVPVQLARYWGEGHNFMMAASIRDRVHRAIAWYGDHLSAPPGH